MLVIMVVAVAACGAFHQTNDLASIDPHAISELGETRSEQLELEGEVRRAKAATAGEYDSEIEAARAFADFDGKLNKLSIDTSMLKMKNKEKLAVMKATKQEANVEADDEDELGEGLVKDPTIFDENAKDLSNDLTFKPQTAQKATLEEADSLLEKMGVGDIEEFLEEEEEETPLPTNELVRQDLVSANMDFLTRADVEANQAIQTAVMKDEDIDAHKGFLDAEKKEQDAAMSMDKLASDEIDLSDSESTSLDLGESDEENLGDVEASVNQQNAKKYIQEESLKEHKEILAEIDKERKMEDEAKKSMLAQMKEMASQVRTGTTITFMKKN